MADKQFVQIGARTDLLELEGKSIELLLEERCVLLEKRLSDPEKHINLSKWTKGQVKLEIARITGTAPDHVIPGRKHDPGPHFKGLYLWAEKNTGEPIPQYIGISQNLESRITGHTRPNNRVFATWAYMMAKQEKGFNDAMADYKQRASMPGNGLPKMGFPGWQKQQDYILKKCCCTVVLEPNDYLLYMLEVYASIRFKSFWNVFQTT